MAWWLQNNLRMIQNNLRDIDVYAGRCIPRALIVSR
mgnify:CR=1 FL=1